MLKRFSLFFIFLILFIATAFSFEGNSSGYQTNNQFIIAATTGASSSYTTTGSGSIIAGNGSSANYVVEFGQLPSCGNNRCDAGETTASCAIDCPAAASSSGGGGGGSNGPSTVAPAPTQNAEQVTRTIPVLIADEPVVVTFTEVPVTQMVLTLSESVFSASVSVKKHTSVPSTVTVPPPLSTVSLVIEFEHPRIDNEQFSSVSFVVDVPRQADLPLGELGVFRYVGAQWQSIPYVVLAQTPTSYQLNVTSPGLSYFAIGKKESASAATPGQSVQMPDVTVPSTPDASVVQLNDAKLISTQGVSYLTLILILCALIAGGFVARALLVKKVEKVQKAPISPSATLMKFNKLDEWIVQGIASGHSPDQLRQRLLQTGWKPEQFENDFKRVLDELER